MNVKNSCSVYESPKCEYVDVNIEVNVCSPVGNINDWYEDDEDPLEF